MKGKIFQKLLTVFMLLVMTLTIIPGAFAAELSEDTKGTLTVSNLETNKQVDVNIYNIMTVNVEGNQPKSPVYIWNAEVANWMKENGYGKYVGEGNAVKDTFRTKKNDEDTEAISSEELAEFYDKLANAIKGGTTIDTSKIPSETKKNAAQGTDPETYGSSVEFTDLNLGNYFILVEGGTRVYKPTSVNIVPKYKNNKWDVEAAEANVKIKSSEPNVVKTIVEEDSEKKATQKNIGDTVDFKLDVNIPVYPENAVAKVFTITDTFSNGLTFNGINTITVTPYNGDTAGEALAASAYDASIDGQVLTIDFSGTKYDAANLANYTKLVITYSATLNENAQVTTGEENTAELTYNNKPYENDSYTPEGDKVKVYTYGLDITKIDGDVDERTTLEGAEFEIRSGNKLLSFVETESGEYRLATDKDNEEDTTTTLVVSSEGKLIVSGLEEGTYDVKETKAPAEYNLLPGAVSFTLEAVRDNDGNVTGILKGNETGVESGYLFRDIENTKGFVLPVTGGIGTLIFSIIGIVFMGTSVVLVRNILKKNEA